MFAIHLTLLNFDVQCSILGVTGIVLFLHVAVAVLEKTTKDIRVSKRLKILKSRFENHIYIN